jgi:hypothetical protein
MFTFPLTVTEIEEVTKNFRGKYSAGIDEIPDYGVNKCTGAIKKLLAHIWNASLESGAFPDILKIAKVKLLHKKGDKSNMQNYRPISRLCDFSKILEKPTYNRLTSFLS